MKKANKIISSILLASILLFSSIKTTSNAFVTYNRSKNITEKNIIYAELEIQLQKLQNAWQIAEKNPSVETWEKVTLYCEPIVQNYCDLEDTYNAHLYFAHAQLAHTNFLLALAKTRPTTENWQMATDQCLQTIQAYKDIGDTQAIYALYVTALSTISSLSYSIAKNDPTIDNWNTVAITSKLVAQEYFNKKNAQTALHYLAASKLAKAKAVLLSAGKDLYTINWTNISELFKQAAQCYYEAGNFEQYQNCLYSSQQISKFANIFSQ